MPDVVAVVSITITLITALGGILLSLHLKKCHSICCDSECAKTPPNTPVVLNDVPVYKQPPRNVQTIDI